MEAGKGGGDALHGLTDVVVGGGVAEADVAGEAEGGSVDGGYVGFFEQIHGEVGGVGDDTGAVGLAEE